MDKTKLTEEAASALASAKALSARADAWFDPLVDVWRKKAGSAVSAGLLLIVLFFLGFWAAPACAGGYGDSTPTQPAGTSASAAAEAFAASQATATGGAGGGGTAYGGSSNNKTYVGGSTGLTSTAPCLGSVGILFNAVSTTVAQEGCVLRLYADRLCGDIECKQKMACLDPDLIPEAKTVLGCPPSQ